MLAPLTLEDRAAAHRVLVSPRLIENLDTRLGTSDVVRLIKAQGQCWGSVQDAEDGPYPEYSRWIDRHTRGAHVRVFHDEDLIREGYVIWNELANRTTGAALDLRHATREPQPGEQVPLFV